MLIRYPWSVALCALAALLVAWAGPATAGPVGELRRSATERSAALRDAGGRDQVRVTVWYPAAADAVERPLVIGPPGDPLFEVGKVARDPPFAADAGRLPVILLSHGFGGTARITGWLGIALARAGYVVVAVDHPGNNAIDAMTPAGATLWWMRADDLRAALAMLEHDTVVGPHLDMTRLGVAGFSLGGFTGLVAGGARVDLGGLRRFCAEHSADGMCRPQPEFRVTADDRAALLARPEIAAEAVHAGDDHSIPRVRAIFAIAPGLVQALDPASLGRLAVPVSILLGEADDTAPPKTNGLAAAAAITGAELKTLPEVGHYDFLAACTEAGKRAIPQCRGALHQAEAHAAAVEAATAFFARTLAPRP